MLWKILIIVAAIIFVVALAICKAAGIADEAMEKLYMEQRDENSDKETH